MTEGWGGLEPAANKQTKEEKSKQKELEAAFKICFAGPEGNTVLKYLKRVTVDRPILSHYHSDGTNTAIDMAGREGENRLYRTIMNFTKKED